MPTGGLAKPGSVWLPTASCVWHGKCRVCVLMWRGGVQQRAVLWLWSWGAQQGLSPGGGAWEPGPTHVRVEGGPGLRPGELCAALCSSGAGLQELAKQQEQPPRARRSSRGAAPLLEPRTAAQDLDTVSVRTLGLRSTWPQHGGGDVSSQERVGRSGITLVRGKDLPCCRASPGGGPEGAAGPSASSRGSPGW